MYVVRADYPSVNILASIPLFDGKPCFMLTYSNVDSRVFVNFLYLLRVRNSGNVVLIMLSFTSLLMFSLLLLGFAFLASLFSLIELVWEDLKRWVNTYYYSCYALELRMSSIIWFLRVIILGIGLISFVTCLRKV